MSLPNIIVIRSSNRLVSKDSLQQQLMGQNNSVNLNITNVIKEWIPTESDPSILINRKTKQHLQCYHMQISLGDLLKEVGIYNVRIQAVYPYICKIAYFNEVHNASVMKGYRRFAVYTDHLFFIRDYQWSTPRFIDVIEGIITLTSYYGYFRITEKMIFVNEKGETKIWISENPVNNHRDYVVNVQEQAVAAFAGLATLKNYEVANLLIGCNSLKDALMRLKKPRRKKVNQFNNLSHNEDSGVKKGIPMNFYRSKKEQKINNINVQLHIGIKNQETKHYSIYQKSGKAVSSRSVSPCKGSFINNQSKKRIFQNTHTNHSQSKNNQNIKIYPSMQFQRGFKFQGSPKMRPTTNLPLKSTLFASKKQDITIINNNVSHITNNIMQNHPDVDKNYNTLKHFREARTPEFVIDNFKQENSPSQKKEKGSAPLFLQKKNRLRDDSFNHNKTQYYDKGYTELYLSKPSIPNNDSLHHSAINMKKSHQFDHIKGRQTDISKQRSKNVKQYTFFQPSSSVSQTAFNKSFSPQSKTPSNYVENKNFTQFFKKANRTYTTNFNDISKSNELTDKKSKNVSFNKIIPQDITEFVSSKSIQIHSTPSEINGDASLKKQLKLQFSHLLGTQSKIQVSKQELMIQIPQQQNSLKQKIQQKRMAFAQLKKEALAVLTDLF